ncbi:solute carrier family 66 member 2-like isoform X1 [Biomphalaria glabrata]|uniref:Solute carrier family 66 member 2 n=2 Tax=Biomphalaria TaxID=6525 RepID=A0A9W3AXZ9_BIOGL|nr:solute carrier family 66 member 2-like isoform X1 [Biomphalaria glabrata]XP_055892101.1 solute carrier family 66 member 2-like isoform X1 [Biomphalaria glabrata]KAK0051527.1 PQ-loop repeat-containing protein 1-like isoform X1 [Biomphalaria pfeifferi]
MDALSGFDLTTFSIMGFTIMEIISLGSQAAMVLGGVVPFIPQYIDIWKSRNADGFSLFVCLALLIANILRIMFWFGKHYELPLLAQSIIMIITMLVLVQLCVDVKNRTEIISSKQRKFTGSFNSWPVDAPVHSLFDFEREYFWKWTDFLSYVEFIALFSLVIGLLTYIFLNSVIYVELLGFMAVFTEAMLGAPQFLRNYQKKSTLGMSRKMVGFWTCGDCFKTVYFILREAPAQFWICGMLQVSIDISIFLQVFFYRHNNVPPIDRTAKSAIS